MLSLLVDPCHILIHPPSNCSTADIKFHCNTADSIYPILFSVEARRKRVSEAEVEQRPATEYFPYLSQWRHAWFVNIIKFEQFTRFVLYNLQTWVWLQFQVWDIEDHKLFGNENDNAVLQRVSFCMNKYFYNSEKILSLGVWSWLPKNLFTNSILFLRGAVYIFNFTQT